MYASGGCSLANNSAKCDSTRAGYEKELQQTAEISILAFRWDKNFEEESFLLELDQLIEVAKTNSEKVIVMAQPPLLNFGPSKIENCNRLNVTCPRPEAAVNPLYPAYNEAIKQRVTALGAEFFDPYQAVEDPTQLYDGDKLLYSDMDHLSVYGGRWLYGKVATQASELLSN